MSDFVQQVSRLDDSEPWFSGDWLSSTNEAATTTNAQCTSGFNWILWSDLAERGSTANHCSAAYWYNNGVIIGVPDLNHFSPAADTELIKDIGGDEFVFYPLAWVGSQNTTDSRYVRYVDTDLRVGKRVVLSGARSGLQVGKIVDPEFYVASLDANVVLMDTLACEQGDSGGPWLNTTGPNHPHPGAVVAYGQHRGYSTVPGHEGCGWVPVTYISSKVHASIYIYGGP